MQSKTGIHYESCIRQAAAYADVEPIVRVKGNVTVWIGRPSHLSGFLVSVRYGHVIYRKDRKESVDIISILNRDLKMCGI